MANTRSLTKEESSQASLDSDRLKKLEDGTRKIRAHLEGQMRASYQVNLTLREQTNSLEILVKGQKMIHKQMEGVIGQMTTLNSCLTAMNASIRKDRVDYKSPRLDFPIFEGIGAREWRDRCRDYFLLYQIEEREKITLSKENLRNRAYTWSWSYIFNHPNESWELFAAAFCKKFEEPDERPKEDLNGNGNAEDEQIAIKEIVTTKEKGEHALYHFPKVNTIPVAAPAFENSFTRIFIGLPKFGGGKIGKILSCKVGLADDGKSKGYGVVQNENEEYYNSVFIGGVKDEARYTTYTNPKSFEYFQKNVIREIVVVKELSLAKYHRRRDKEFAVEGSSAESIATLAKNDTVKQRIESAYITLQDAADLTQLNSTIEDVFAIGDLPRIAEILDEGFAQHLPHVIPLAFNSWNLDDGSAVDIDKSDEDENVSGFGGFSSDDEALDEPRIHNTSLRTGILDEKAAATQTLDMFAQHTQNSYASYLEESLKILVKHSSYFHEDVHSQAIIGLKHILIAAQEECQGHIEIMAKIKEFLHTVRNIYLKTMTEDVDKEVVAQACMSVADIIRDFGGMAAEPCKNGGEYALKYYGDVLRGLYPLFGKSEPDNAVRDNATGAVARTIMVHLESIPFNQVLPVLLKVLPLKEDHEESMAVYSCICNLVLSSDPEIKFREFIPSILHVSRQCLASGEEEVVVFAFEIFDELIESPAPLLGKSVKSIVQFALEECSSPNLESNTKHQAIQIMSWLAKYKSNSMKKYKLVVPILQVMCPLLAESSDRNEDDDLAPDQAAAEFWEAAISGFGLECSEFQEYTHGVFSNLADGWYNTTCHTTFRRISVEALYGHKPPNIAKGPYQLRNKETVNDNFLSSALRTRLIIRGRECHILQ